jgi:hypothetical protein
MRRLAALALGCWVGCVAVAPAQQTPPTPTPTPANAQTAEPIGAPVDRDAELARRFRPHLMLDSHELWRPLDVERFLAEGWHRVCRRPGGPCPAIAGAGDLRSFGRGPGGTVPYLLVDGRTGLGARSFPSRDRRCGALECVPGRIYFHVSHDADFLYLDYWWYFRFNDSPGGDRYDHQSDWEGVVVALDRRDQSTFAWVGFAAHDSVWRYLRGSLSCDGAAVQGSCGTESGRFGRRVDVFVASGTHAAYPAACRPLDSRVPIPFKHLSCRENERIPQLTVLHVPEASFDGRRPWDADGDPRGLAPLGPWAAWPGTWDPAGNVRSPAAQRRYRDPRHATDTACPPDGCSYTPPKGFERACRGWFGLQAVAAACDAGLLEAGAHGSALLRLRRGIADFGTGLAPPLETMGGQDVPGVAQLVGAPLAVGETVSLDGIAGPETDLFVRAAAGRRIYDARFSDLGLESGGRATVTWTVSEPGEPPELLLHRPDGSDRRPRAVVEHAASR